MAGIPRSPGSTGSLSRSQMRSWSYGTVTNTDGSHKTDKTFVTNSQMQKTTIDSRPFYGRSKVTTLPGGTKFRYPTPYIHTSTNVQFDGSYNAFGWNQWGSIIQYPVWSRIYDGGREVGALVTSDRFVIGDSASSDSANEAITKALNKIAGDTVNLGENLLTLGQTVRMFTSKADLLRKALEYGMSVKSWRKLLSKSARDLKHAGPLNVAASNYLEYVYGLRPLMSDVHTLHQMLKRHSSGDLMLKATGSSSRDGSGYTGPFGPFSYTSVKVRSSKFTRKTRCTLWARIDPNHQGLRAANQLGLVNPLALAWELVPYSFVVDWFIPVGPVLYALSAKAGLRFVSGTLSSRATEVQDLIYRTESFGCDSTKFDKRRPWHESFPTVTRTRDVFSRSVYTDWPIPSLYWAEDPFKADRSLKALALSISALGSRWKSHR